MIPEALCQCKAGWCSCRREITQEDLLCDVCRDGCQSSAEVLQSVRDFTDIELEKLSFMHGRRRRGIRWRTYKGKHRRVPPHHAKTSEHGNKLMFGAIGLFVFIAGTVLQWALLKVLGPDTSYIWQTLFSVELSYVLNRWLTWPDRHVQVFSSLVKWNVQRLALTLPNIAVYDLLLHQTRLNWLAANIIATGLFIVINYVAADRWTFTITKSWQLPHWEAAWWYRPLPLLAVLGVQTGLSLRLVWSNTAFQDEALYLWAGHLEWSYWLHGTAIPAFATYFSGAPVIYPAIGALADSIGGLAGARILSLCFMLGATVLLWATTRRLFGEVAAFFAAASWAVLGPTLHLSAFATFDAMSMFFIALAAYLATARRTTEDAAIWMAAAAVALALANATTYSSAIFDPIVILLAILSAWPQPGGKAAMRRGVLLGVVALASVYAVLWFGGSYYRDGVNLTVLARQIGQQSPSEVLADALQWVAVITIAAAAGLLLAAVRRDWHDTWLLGTCVLAAIIVPLQQARIHTYTSLDKHADIGVWFAAIAAGYAVSTLASLWHSDILRAGVIAAALAGVAAMAVTGFSQAKALFSWPNTANYVNVLRPVINGAHGSLLVDTDDVLQYYLPSGHAWQRWSNTFAITLISGRSMGTTGGVNASGQIPVYESLIKRGYFSVIVLDSTGSATEPFDQALLAYLQHAPDYRLVRTIHYDYMTSPVYVHVTPERRKSHHPRHKAAIRYPHPSYTPRRRRETIIPGASQSVPDARYSYWQCVRHR